MNKTKRRYLVEKMNDAFINRQMTSAQDEFQAFYDKSRNDIFKLLNKEGRLTKIQVRGIMKENASLLEQDPLILKGIRVNLVMSSINNVITNPLEPIDEEIETIIKASGGIKNTNKIADNSYKFATKFYSSPYFKRNEKVIKRSFVAIKRQRRFTSQQIQNSTQNFMTAKINEIMRKSYSTEEFVNRAEKFYKKATETGQITLFSFDKDGKPVKRIRKLNSSEMEYFKSFDENRILRMANTELNTIQQQVEFIKNANDGHTQKRWVNEGDDKVRDTHKGIMGWNTKKYWIPIDEPFNVGGYKAMFPAQNTLPPQERIGCRCSLIFR